MTAPTALPLPSLPDGVDIQDLITTLISPYDDARAMLLRVFASAQTSIYIADYALTMPDLVELLIAKAHDGVLVTVVLDRSQSAGVTEHPLVQHLIDASHNIAALSVTIATSPVKEAIMHLKCGVVDSWLTVDGSFNFSGYNEQSGAQTQLNDINVIPSRKRAHLFVGRIIAVRDWALAHEAQQLAPVHPPAGAAATLSEKWMD